MTKKEIYEQVVQLTNELVQIKFAEKVFGLANEGNPVKTQEAIDTFRKEYPELNAKIISFGKKFNELIEDGAKATNGAVFGGEPDESNNIYVFDTSIIDALSFYAFTIIGQFDEFYLFNSWYDADEYCIAIKQTGYINLFEFVFNGWFMKFVDKYTTVGELLVEIFAGNVK